MKSTTSRSLLISAHYDPHVAYPDHRIGRRGSHHQCRCGEDSDNAYDRDNALDHDNHQNVRPRVHEGSLAHADSRDGKHRDPAADGQLADLDRLIEEGHL